MFALFHKTAWVPPQPVPNPNAPGGAAITTVTNDLAFYGMIACLIAILLSVFLIPFGAKNSNPHAKWAGILLLFGGIVGAVVLANASGFLSYGFDLKIF